LKLGCAGQEAAPACAHSPHHLCAHPAPPAPGWLANQQDVYKMAEQIRAVGGSVTREPGPVGAAGTTKIVATQDPDGWDIAFVDAADFENELAQQAVG